MANRFLILLISLMFLNCLGGQLGGGEQLDAQDTCGPENIKYDVNKQGCCSLSDKTFSVYVKMDHFCCGGIVGEIPVNEQNNQHLCCGTTGNVYDTATQKCCADGTVVTMNGACK